MELDELVIMLGILEEDPLYPSRVDRKSWKLEGDGCFLANLATISCVRKKGFLISHFLLKSGTQRFLQ